MAQGPVTASELERVIRQDGFPTRYSREQDEFPTAYDVSGRNFHYANPPILSESYPVRHEQTQQVQNSATKTKGGICGLTLWLAIAVIILLVLAIVEGGLLGSKIARNRNNCSELESNENLASSAASSLATISPTSFSFPTTISSSSRSSLISIPTTSIAVSSQSPVAEPLAQPNNDCQAFGKRFTAKVGDTTNVTQFEINCNTDYIGGDISSFYSPSLLTCMEGCTLFNYWRVEKNNHRDIICASVVYVADIVSIGNCFLKLGDTSVMSRAENISYAKVISNEKN